MSLQGQDIIDVQASGAVAVANTVDCCYGVEATLLTAPATAKHLVLIAQRGGFTLRLGDRVAAGMPAAFLPSADITNGTAGVPIPEGQTLVIPAPTLCTVKGYAADSALIYYFI